MNDITTREEYLEIMKQNWGEPSFEICTSCGHDKICHYEFWSPENDPPQILNGTSACDMITCKCKRFTNDNKSS